MVLRRSISLGREAPVRPAHFVCPAQPAISALPAILFDALDY